MTEPDNRSMSDTLAAPASHAMEVKHSRFLARAASVDSVDAALAWLADIADPDATHNCWAYRIGDDYRSSDDGEVAGTAGRPILAAIDGQGYDRVVVLVTRWYGGVKLGTGGLVRAYGGAAAECLRIAMRQPLVAMRVVQLQAAFDDIGAVHAAMVDFDAEKIEETFNPQGASVRLSLPAERVDALATHLRNATSGRITLTPAKDPV